MSDVDGVMFVCFGCEVGYQLCYVVDGVGFQWVYFGRFFQWVVFGCVFDGGDECGGDVVDEDVVGDLFVVVVYFDWCFGQGLVGECREDFFYF